MTATPEELSPTQLLAAATEVLLDGGYEQADRVPDGLGIRMFEDALGIVGVIAYETWPQLVGEWHLAQGQLVDAMTRHLDRREPKAWEGYLVLMTSDLTAPPDQLVLSDLRNDTNRVRKIVATGTELTDVGAVRDALLPLLPIDLNGVNVSHAVVLDMLVEILRTSGISEQTTAAVIRAFADNESVIEAIHAQRSNQ